MADDFEAPPAEQEVSIHDALSDAFAADAGEAGVQATATIPNPGETQAQADERARDAQGRFAKPAEAVHRPPSEPNAQGAVAEPPKQETIRPPASWSATAKADFEKLAPHIQQEVLKREKDIEQGQAQWQSKGERLNRLDAVLGPRSDWLRLRGVSEDQFVGQLVAAHDLLEKDGPSGIAYLARQYGVDLRQFGQGGPAQAAPQQNMPPVIQQLLSKVQSLESTLTQQRGQANQAAMSQVVSQIEAFKADPKHLYFENVQADMENLLRSGRSQTLEDAYDKAVWANPETRPLMQRALDEQRAADARQRTHAARQASGSVIGSPTPGSGPASGAPAPTIRDELARAFADAS